MNYIKPLGTVLLASVCLFACAETVQNTPVKKVNNFIGKPSSAPISMSYQVLTKTPKVGQPIEVATKFTSNVLAPIDVKLTSAKQMKWSGTETFWQSKLNAQGKYQNVPTFNVTAKNEGTFYIRLMASIEVDGKVRSKPFVIPVTVGQPLQKLESNANVKTDSKGQKIIIQKAEQSN